MKQKERDGQKTSSDKPVRNREKFSEALEQLRRSGLKVTNGYIPGGVNIFIGGVRPPEKKDGTKGSLRD